MNAQAYKKFHRRSVIASPLPVAERPQDHDGPCACQLPPDGGDAHLRCGAQNGYVRALLDLALRAQAIGLTVRFEFILYQPSVTRARDMLAAIFAESDCTHMLFVDADARLRRRGCVRDAARDGRPR